ncbi:MAG TPA: hypothetical protein VN943_06695, partial [Candidatus Acidoferrum sp.]|nr:hypothetical protein [Candidatus Acidoferrum sp.]
GVRDALAARAGKVKDTDPLHKQLVTMSESVDAMRKKIVATKEGGAITGEERIREKSSSLYGDLTNYEGRPADYQLARIDSLKKELGDVETEFEGFVTKNLPAINKSLVKEKLEKVEPLTRQQWEAASGDVESGSSSSATSVRMRK